MNIELLSIDLSNFCSKQCPFCYNHSNMKGNVLWKPKEIIALAKDCVNNGVKAVSLGGGEPFEYDGIFQIIDALQPIAYLSVTTNGLPLLDDDVRQALLEHRPDKIHITIHNPDNDNEVQRVFDQIKNLSETDITLGVNLLVASDKLEYCRDAYTNLRTILSQKQIILVPQRFDKTPTPKQLAHVTDNEQFQAPSCILECRAPENFCAVSWDKKVNFCSYAGEKQPLKILTYQGIINALELIEFQTCLNL
ncbi:radical SAM protein [uncultured Muribaculum sp.]|uniref:radical SAM protein n=1 Tax=uncultured Muribaculum sp. TaxID=1918613 RepID=UPI00273096B4|nr:radical SAM protein [uncultured Muribaculum sp.]